MTQIWLEAQKQPRSRPCSCYLPSLFLYLSFSPISVFFIAQILSIYSPHILSLAIYISSSIDVFRSPPLIFCSISHLSSLFLFLRTSICLCLSLSACLSVCLSVCFSLSLSLSFSLSLSISSISLSTSSSVSISHPLFLF